MYSVAEIRERVEESIANIKLPDDPSELYAPVAYMLSIGGKRIRPMLCLMSYNLFTDCMEDKALYSALGLEIFHSFTLLHDDIMDNSPLRRNQATVHNKWGIRTAILSGDVMCIAAYKYMCRTDISYQTEIINLFNRTAMQVCEGQQYDMTYEDHLAISEAEYLQMINLKTAVLIAASAKIGAVIAGAPVVDADKMYRFGQDLGMAFQIQDDLLDVYGDVDVFGKNIGLDILNNKKTYLLVTALRQAKGEDKNRLHTLLKTKDIAPEKKIEDVLEIYHHLKIRRQAEECISGYFDRALVSLDEVDAVSERKIYLQELAHGLLRRDK